MIMKIIGGAALLVVVIGIYVAVAYVHEKKMGTGGCTGNCAGCSMHESGCDSQEKKA